MSDYLLDTVTLVRYLSGAGKIPVKVKGIFDKADKSECRLFISSISFIEILYLSEKNRIPITLDKVVEKIRKSPIYEIVDLSIDIILTAKSVKYYELHDRLILSTAKFLDIPIISSDKKFKKIDGIKVIW